MAAANKHDHANGEPLKASRLSDLAQMITQDINLLEDYYSINKQPEPSFQAGAVVESLPKEASIDVKEARGAALDHGLEVFDLLSGPSQILSNLTIAYQTIAALRWLCHFDILRHVPFEGDISFADLSSQANVPEPSLKSVARMGMTAHILCEPAAERVAHTAASRNIATSQPLHDWAVFIAKEAVQIAMSMVEATEKWQGSTKINETPFNIALDTDLSFFEHLKKRPDHMKIYAGYQKAVASTEGLDLQHLVRGYDWAALGKATVVDVGGSVGMASAALAHAFPNLSFVVQDLPEVVADGQKFIDAPQHASVVGRIRYEAHDFFEPQPVEGAEVYLLRMILHYWSLADTVKILRALIPALRADRSRILIVDTVLPTPGTISNAMERQLRVRDLAMMQLHGSHERDPASWDAIVKASDERFEIKRLNLPFGSELAVMEVVMTP